MPEARTAYLSLGANLGDKAAMLARATARLAAMPDVAVVARSGLYRTPPWGDLEQDWFLNAALGLRTTLAPHALLDACLALEAALGRVRARRWGPRAIDLDLLTYEGAVLSDARLTLPHPLMLERAFVLVPLAEIASDLVVAGTRVGDALARLDAGGIERVGALPPACDAHATSP